MSVNRKNRDAIRRLCVTAVLSALAVGLMYLEFPVPLMPEFLKFDFSDLPALIASFGVSPWAGVIVELIKNLVHIPATMTGGVGELANFLIGAAFVLPAGLCYRLIRGRRGALIGSLAGALAASLICLPVNYWLTYPAYTAFIPMDAILWMYQAINPAASTLWRALLMFNLPFTFVKGLINVGITFAIYKPLSPLLHGRRRSA